MTSTISMFVAFKKYLREHQCSLHSWQEDFVYQRIDYSGWPTRGETVQECG